ncbi:hypothetical protein GGR32_000820 [Mesonia hippocampi]|uniref:Uncharacterized protein n=1 Tax=Mesonia hippocampi TaxID=1628250 RepID=A0A840ET11_9FLAO|nr:hypothetical protein [Mesonia hippocampi]MBB4118546.1 hypothetical protein [Mesonia hippocampi]
MKALIRTKISYLILGYLACLTTYAGIPSNEFVFNSFASIEEKTEISTAQQYKFQAVEISSFQLNLQESEQNTLGSSWGSSFVPSVGKQRYKLQRTPVFEEFSNEIRFQILTHIHPYYFFF